MKKKSQSSTKQLRKQIIVNKNKSLLKLREWSCQDVEKFLLELGIQSKSQFFNDQKVDGSKMIHMITNIEFFLCSFQYDFGFTEQEIEKLLQAYLFIYTFRKKHSNNFRSDEAPLY